MSANGRAIFGPDRDEESLEDVPKDQNIELRGLSSGFQHVIYGDFFSDFSERGESGDLLTDKHAWTPCLPKHIRMGEQGPP
jgi:hypothetical protein